MQKSKYNYIENQKKWDRKWKDAKIYQPDLDFAKNPYYVLYMFPYPSAEGLHVGHAFSGTGADVYARFMRMKGYDVFHPMGFDAFGIHSENYALKINDHPKNLIDRATKHFRQQFDSLGFSYDWTHSVNTSSPDYYKWTQWLFIQLFKAGLAEKKKAEVNWCPSCKTVLADEQVLSGVCERCSSIVEKKQLEQWFFKITDYADRLLEGLDRIDWTEKVKLAQKNWIGKSEGLLVRFEIKDLGLKNGGELFVEVFTTKPETIDGATFIVLSPQHQLVVKLLNFKLNEVREYVKRARNKSDKDLDKEKTGIFSGIYAINPVTNKEIPIWIADYVLAGYGTGAIMAVPYADERDKEFAKKFDLPIVETSFDSKPKGQKQTHYHLRDWLISRQRYWGAPIPIIYCRKCWEIKNQKSKIKNEYGKDYINIEGVEHAIVSVPEDQLPVLLPFIENFRPLGTGSSPLAQDKDFVNTSCPVCNGPAKRETDVCDTFLDSSWYFLRYPVSDFKYVPIASKAFLENPKSEARNTKQIQNSNKENSKEFRDSSFEIRASARRAAWLPVPMYIGGAEHSVLHLLYSRFVTKVLFDLKLLDFDEPFTKFRAHGLLIKDGAKMSKSKGNVINPDEYISKYGADTLRCYLMFLGPFNQGGDFRDSGIEGMERFLKRVRKLVEKSILASEKQSKESSAKFTKDPKLERSVNKTIKGVGEDVESLRYNTALAKIMEYVNDLNASKDIISPEYLKILILLLTPFAPYLTEELWEIIHARGPSFAKASAGRPAARFPATPVKQASSVTPFVRSASAHSRSTDSALSGVPSTPVTPRKEDHKSSIINHQSVHVQPWPTFDESKISQDEVVIAIQVNGKLRSVFSIEYSVLSNKSEIEKKAREDPKISKYIKGKQIKKVIYVPGKILNFVV